MNILWICNIVLPPAAKMFKLPVSPGGGWLESMLPYLLLDEDFNITVAGPADCPSYQKIELEIDLKDYVIEPDLLQGHAKRKVEAVIFSREMTGQSWLDLLAEVKPDVIHLQGTEYPYGYALMQAAPQYKYVTSLQGIPSFYATHFTADLPHKVVSGKRLYDLIRKDSVRQGQKRFIFNGKREQKILQESSAVIGRTDWDRTCAHFLAPQTPYYHCGENLRSPFYCYRWELERCEPYSIFISQASYPIKGFHMFLQGLPYVLREFPKTRVYVAGQNRIWPQTFMDKLKQNYYMHYLQKEIIRLNLAEHIIFTGPLDESAMLQRLIKSHVFVSPSVIENSPNSVGEAMLLGVPVVSSNVGGVSSMMTDEREGLFYPYQEPYTMAAKIIRIFRKPDLAHELSQAARKRATRTHDRLANAQETGKIYRRIGGVRE